MLLRLAQLSMAVSLYFTARALYHTWGHGFADNFFGEPIGSHMQFHAVREVFMALGLVAVTAYFMYGPAAVRNRTGWFMILVSSAFLTVGVLISLPITGNTLPNLEAMMNHIGNTSFAVLALALCWKDYGQQAPSAENTVGGTSASAATG